MKQDFERWAKAAIIRAIRTFAEAMLAYVGGDAVGAGKLILSDVNWVSALSAGAFGFIIAILLALAGLPEADS